MKIYRTMTRASGYQYLYMPHHPLAKAGKVYAHRYVLYSLIGDGPHQCQLCKAHINWGSGLEADHINGDRGDNRPSNLRAVCVPCNRARRKFNTNTIVCEHCGTTSDNRGHRARYCSKACKQQAWLVRALAP